MKNFFVICLKQRYENGLVVIAVNRRIENNVDFVNPLKRPLDKIFQAQAENIIKKFSRFFLKFPLKWIG